MDFAGAGLLDGLEGDERAARLELLERLAAHAALKLFLESGLPEESVTELNRVLGEGMARFAAAVGGAFTTAFLGRGDTEHDVALRFSEMAETLGPAVAPVLVAALNAHLREIASRGMIGREQLRSGRLAGAQDVVVCFADLVGFTALGGQIAAEELGGVAGRLAALAAEVATGPVRLVKTIGDAAMFVSPEVVPTVDAALTLVEAIEAAELPALRAGITIGPALQRAGDRYGHPVNLASRVTGVARPGSVLCTQEIRERVGRRVRVSFAGRYRLKGVPEPVPLHRARRRADAPEALEEAEREAPEPERSTRPRSDRPRRRASRSRGS